MIGQKEGSQRSQDQDSRGDQQDADKQSQKQDNKSQQAGSAPQDQPKPANPQTTQATQRDGTLTREQAVQILDALKNQELAEQRRLLEQRARRKTNQRDW